MSLSLINYARFTLITELPNYCAILRAILGVAGDCGDCDCGPRLNTQATRPTWQPASLPSSPGSLHHSSLINLSISCFLFCLSILFEISGGGGGAVWDGCSPRADAALKRLPGLPGARCTFAAKDRDN